VQSLDPATRTGPTARILFLIAVVFSLFQVYTAAYSPISSLVVRSLHVGFLLLLAFGLNALDRPQGSPMKLFDWALGLLAFAIGFYHWWFEADIIWRAGDPNETDIVVGTLAVALVFEAARRFMGWALPTICGLFLAYVLLGEYLPAPLHHRGYAYEQVVDHMYLGTEGIYGIPTYVSSTYLYLFILFGSFLEQAGMVKLFTDFAMGTVGHQRGGPAKVSTISSGLMGTINGSGVANVVTTGQFTIPLMKRFGYKPAFAGAVEATASMGGQIMPPVMGAVAFIMAETLGVEYVEIVKAATVPALLYFATILWTVHLEAGRRNLMGLPKEECPNPWTAVRQNGHLILPLAGLVYLLFTGYTPLFAGTVAMGLTVVLILGTTVQGAVGNILVRMVFWVVVALACSAFLEYGITAVFGVIAVLAAANFFVRGGMDTLKLAVNGLAAGARNALGVGIACALVGVIIGTMTLTGLASTFAGTIVALAGDSIFLSLFLTMIACLILGMGIPTIPNYIITSSLVGPALLELGVPLIVTHMFVFYFGIMADLTPPVALAAFAASSIARESAMKIGMQCMRIAIAGWVVPYMFVYDPSLLVQPGPKVVALAADLSATLGGFSDFAAQAIMTGYMIVKALLAIGLWGVGAIGFLWQKVSWPARILATAGAALLVVATQWSDMAGFAVGIAFFAWQFFANRHPRVARV